MNSNVHLTSAGLTAERDSHSFHLESDSVTPESLSETTDDHAPQGKLWLCMMCGKTAKDCCGDEGGWDEGCALNCLLVDEATKQPTGEQVAEFHAERNRRLADFPRRMRELRGSISNGTYQPDPELLALARAAIDRRAASTQPDSPPSEA